MAGYFKDVIKDFAEILAPLINLTKDSLSEPFILSEQEQNAVNQLKQKVCEYPILQFPDLICHSF